MNAKRTYSNQERFFKRLARRFEKKGDMVAGVGKALHLGRDAVYRRLRGETILSTDELYLLAEHFSIKLQPDRKGPAQVSYPTAVFQPENEVDFYRGFADQCEWALKLPGLSVDYATPELPIYFELFASTLLSFKTYVYGLTAWNFEKWRKVSFRPELINPEVLEMAKPLRDALFNIPGRELWSVRILDTTLRQIEHAVDIGRLPDYEQVKKMYEELDAVIDHMEDMTHRGKRFAPGTTPTATSPDLFVYHNEMTNTNHVTMVKSDTISFFFSNIVTPNYVHTSDPTVNQQTSLWFDNMVSMANPLHGPDVAYARKFFTQLRYAKKASEQRAFGVLSPSLVSFS